MNQACINQSKWHSHYRWLVEYDGSCFHGWQSQGKLATVQGALAEAWRELTGENIIIFGSSRTDAGVHALGHVSDFFTNTTIPANRVAMAMNSALPSGVAVLGAEDAPWDFSSRYGARGKRYRYTLWLRSAPPTIQRNYVAYVRSQLDFAKMDQAAELLVREMDFTGMMDQGSPTKRTQRRVTKCQWNWSDPHSPFLIVEGDGFLYHMVRIMAGTLVAVGQGKISVTDLPQLIEAKQRTLLGKTMPASGLCLEAVYYEDCVFGQPAWPFKR